MEKIKKLTAIVTALALAATVMPFEVFAAVPTEIFSVPMSAGKVTSAKYYGSDYVVVNVQDLHCHPQVQRNISGILGYMDEKYNVGRVYLEGADTVVDTSLLSEIMKKDFGRQTVEALTDNGYLSGCEYYSALKDKSNFIYGIEDKKLYDRNIRLFNDILSAAPQAQEICAQMLDEIKSLRKDYSNKKTKKLNNLIRRYEKNRINAAEFYAKLCKLAAEENIDFKKYKNIDAYVNLIKNGKDINNDKTIKELREFINVLKNEISYQRFAELSLKSGNFSDIENIFPELADIAAELSIFGKNKFSNLQNLFAYLEFNKIVNPMEFVSEEKAIKKELYEKYVSNKFEREVIFLSEFIPEIKGYFTANITAEELSGFKEKFKDFRRVWCSYFSENNAKKLDKYAAMLEEYHSNNIKRDSVFASIISEGRSGSFAEAKYGREALSEINKEINSKEIKLIVTGGFHSRGLEKYLDENKISYVIITPNISGDTAKAYEVYLNTIKSYKDIEKNTINIEPFMKGPLSVKLPMLVTAAFNVKELKKYSVESQKAGLKEFIDEFLTEYKKRGQEKEADIQWEIDKYANKEIRFSISYQNNVKKYSADNKGNFKNIEENAALSAKSGNGKNLLSIADGFFKNTKSGLYKIMTVVIVPVAEEFVFRFLPFAALSLLTSNPVSIIPLTLTMLASAFLFSYAHEAADKLAFKMNPFAKARDYFKIDISGVILTGLYAVLYVIFPGSQYIALAATVVLHLLNNALSLSRKITNPLLNIFQDGLETKKTDKEIIDESLEYIEIETESFTAKDWYYLNEPERYGKADVGELKRLIKRIKTIEQPDEIMKAYFEIYKRVGVYLRNHPSNSLFKKTHENIKESAYILIVRHMRNIRMTDPELLKNFFSDIERNTRAASIFAAKAYEIDNELGFEMINKLSKLTVYEGEVKKIIKFSPLFSNVGSARKQLPYGWNDVLVSDQDVINFYESLGSLFLTDEYKSKAFSFEKADELFNNLRTMLESLKPHSEEYERLVLEMREIIKILFIKAEDPAADRQTRANIATELARATNLNKDISYLLDIERINALFKELNMKNELMAPDAYIKNFTEDNKNGMYLDRHNYTPLIKMLPDEVLPAEKVEVKPPVLFEMKWNGANNSQMSKKLKSLSEINSIVLSKYSEVKSNYSEAALEDLFRELESMIFILKEINEREGNAAIKALNKMRGTSEIAMSELLESRINTNWFLQELSEITSIHTLITAVHQTGINNVVYNISEYWRSSIEGSGVVVRYKGAAVEAKNHSDDENLNDDIKNLFIKLAASQISEDSFYIENDLLIWRKMFAAHSADIFFNFDKNNREISIMFHESGNLSGNITRIYYFLGVLKRFGFKVDISNTFSQSWTPLLKAKLNKDSGLNEAADLTEIAFKIIDLFTYSTNLDVTLSTGADIETLEKLAEKYMAGEMWTRKELSMFLTERLPNPKIKDARKVLDKILTYLELEPFPQELDEELLGRDLLDKYFNVPISDAYLRGKLILDGQMKLTVNRENPIKEKIIDEIESGNISELSAQSQVLNFINYGNMNLKSEYVIGSMIGITGYIKVNGGYVRITGAMDRKTRRMELANTEFADFQGKRKILGVEELKEILNNSGYGTEIYKKKNKQELKAISGKFKQKAENFKDSIALFGTGLASKDRKYVQGFVTYNMDKIRENDILAARYISDKHTENVKGPGLIITSGGSDSHAIVDIREMGKSAVSARAGWVDDKLNTEYYRVSRDIEKYGEYEMHALRSNNISLEEGDALLMNGATGELLVFRDANGSNKIFYELFKYVKNKNIGEIKISVIVNEKSPDLGKILEYLYYSTVGKKEYRGIFDALVNLDASEIVSEKIKRLNFEYLLTLHEEVSKRLEETKKISNLISVKFTQIMRLEEDILLLRLIGKDNNNIISGV
ncbi:MAG: CPBP family intramembrane metalloprotease, partial [Endomicrobium sp.]|nr:CPBP family intramembrane metalloprotease [Endomicrobium sp.]